MVRTELCYFSLARRRILVEDCQAQFDFTQHVLENCDGKCWKSVDLIDPLQQDNRTRGASTGRSATLKSSRRCFSTDELLRATEIGINTSDGCRKVKRDDRKIKEVCFCSDQDMCNGQAKLAGRSFLVLFSNLLIVCSNTFRHLLF